MRRLNYCLLLATGVAYVCLAHHFQDPPLLTAIGLISLLGALTASV